MSIIMKIINKLIALCSLFTLISLSIALGIDSDEFILLKNDDELMSLVFDQCYLDNDMTGSRNIRTSFLIYSALNNSNNQAMKQLLLFAEANGLKLLKTSEQLAQIIGSCDEELAQIIGKCDEETATLAIMQAPELVPGLNVEYFIYKEGCKETWTADFLHLLIDRGLKFENGLQQLHYFKNANDETLIRCLEKVENKAEFFDSENFEDFIFGVIERGRFDWLKILESNGFNLESFATLKEIRDNLLFFAVKSGRDANYEMLNYMLDRINAHGDTLVLSYAASLEDDVLFNLLLEKGYKIDPANEQASEAALALAIYSKNLKTIKYILEKGVNPNVHSILERVIDSQNIEILKLFISYKAKFGGLHIATAAEMGLLEFIKCFHEEGYNIKHPGIFVAACGSENLELIDFFLSNGGNINDPNIVVAAVRKGQFETMKHLIEKGANPKSLVALNEALRSDNLDIAKYLVDKGAVLDQRSFISAGLSGDAESLQWLYEKTRTRIPNELERIFIQSELTQGFVGRSDIVKYALEHFIGKDSVLIGITNAGYHFTDGIEGIAAKLMDQNENIFAVPLSEEVVDDDQLMKRFSGFINPGAGDNYPRNKSNFSLNDIDEDYVYQRVISFAKQYDIPYLGICYGNQQLILNNGGYLQPVKGHGGSVSVQFEKGSIPHYMTLLPNEKAKALQTCKLEDIIIKEADVAHSYAGVKEKLGSNIKLGAISKQNENVPQAVAHGHSQVGVQFHPERRYFDEVKEENGPNRQKAFLDNFFNTTLNYQKSRTYGLEQGFNYETVRDSIKRNNQKLIKRLESCTKDGEQADEEHFWGENFGSYSIEANKGKSVNMLMGLTARDLGLARDGDDLVLVIKKTGEALSIKSHFAADGEHRVKSIDFADGSRLMLIDLEEQIPHIIEDGKSVNLESQPNFYRNASKIGVR